MLIDVYRLRDLADKLARRAKKLIGRADASPWVVRPRDPAAGGGGVDLLVVSDRLTPESPLVRTLHQSSSPRGLTLQVAGLELSTEVIRPRVILNLSTGWTAELSEAADLAGTRVIGGADSAAAVAKLGASGLLQGGAPPVGRRRLLRGVNVLGTRSLLWWTPETAGLEAVTWQDVRQEGLTQAFERVDQVASVTGSDWFSIDLAPGAGGRWSVVDFHGDALGFADPGPAEWVAWACERVAEAVRTQKAGVTPPDGHGVWLPAGAVATATALVSAA